MSAEAAMLMNWHICKIDPAPRESSPEKGLHQLLNQLQKIGLGSSKKIVFQRIGMMALLATAEQLKAGQKSICFSPPGELYVGDELGRGVQTPGEWYVRLLSALEASVIVGLNFDATVLTLSFGPPGTFKWPFNPDEPFLQALRLASDSGVVTVVAAGNDGHHGDRTLNPWAKVPWVIGVGAADASLTKVETWSSRGDPDDPSDRPWVLASGEARVGGKGTSFAAPKVSYVALDLCTVLVHLFRASEIPRARFQPLLLEAVKRFTAMIAQPVEGPRHQIGWGAVDRREAAEWLRAASISDLEGILPNWLRPTASQWRESISRAEPGTREDKTGAPRTASVTIDRSFGIWDQLAYVPGLIPSEKGSKSAGLTNASRRLGNLFDVAGWDRTDKTFIRVSVDPAGRRGAALQVGQQGRYRTISEALDAAKPGDRVDISPGVYNEAIELKSSIWVLGGSNVVLTHGSECPLTLHNVSGIRVAEIKVISTGSDCAPLRMIASDNIEIRDCQFEGRASNGADFVRCWRVQLTGCGIDSAKNGIYAAYSYGMSFNQTKVKSGSVGILSFCSALRVKKSGVSGTSSALLIVVPVQPWPELFHECDKKGNLRIHWVDFLETFTTINLRDFFSATEAPAGIQGELMSEVRSTVIESSELRAEIALITNEPGLVRLNSCQLEAEIDRALLISELRALPSINLEKFALDDALSNASNYLSRIGIAPLPPQW